MQFINYHLAKFVSDSESIQFHTTSTFVYSIEVINGNKIFVTLLIVGVFRCLDQDLFSDLVYSKYRVQY